MTCKQHAICCIKMKGENKNRLFVFAATTAPKPWKDIQEANTNDYLLRLETRTRWIHTKWVVKLTLINF